MPRLLRILWPGVFLLGVSPMMRAQTPAALPDATLDRYAPPPLAALPTTRADANDLQDGLGTPAPPAWRDGASVYLASQDASLPRDTPDHGNAARSPAEVPRGGQGPWPIASPPPVDHPIKQAAHQAETLPSSFVAPDQRRLAAPGDAGAMFAGGGEKRAADRIGRWGVPYGHAYTAGTALALVIGLFLLSAWALRRGAKRSSALLPADVVSVLGRTPLAARHYLQLLRVGNKLVLISVTPGGAETVTEVTDAAEVGRLASLCSPRSLTGATAEFEQVLRTLAREPASKGFLGHEAPVTTGRSVAEVYKAYQGGAERV